MNKPLQGKRILVPPARPEANPLLRILERKGAEVLEFPVLRTAPPADYGPLDEAIRQLSGFDWIIFSGSNCVVNFFERLDKIGPGKAALIRPRIGAIGHGASSALKKRGVEVDYVPRRHTAKDVIKGLNDISGLKLLLVRVEGASRSLPEGLKDLGARVIEVAGYQMLVEASAEMAEKVFGRRLDFLALANPTAVRFLVKAANKLGLDLQESLKGVTIATVGPATAEAAGSHDLAPDMVSKGHIADLAEALVKGAYSP
jgi:uroporphyrinogen III methyltransferase / synthase